MTIAAGNLRLFVTFQEQTETRDAAGGVHWSWSDVLTRRCERARKSGTLFQALAQKYQSMTDLFILRDVDVDPTWRLMFDGLPYRIVDVDNIGSLNREVRIVAEANQPETTVYGN